MGFDRFKASLMRLRGSTDIGDIPESKYAAIPQSKLEEYAQKAAASCSALCRSFIKANMRAAGINSNGLSEAIDFGMAYFVSKRGVVRFRLAGTYNPYVNRSKAGGVWMVAAAQDAGRVVGIKAQASRAKRRIKAGFLDAKSTRAVKQVHNGREVVREAINAAGVKVVPPKKFWEFDAGQSAAITERFRKNFNGLINRHLGKPA